MSIKKTVPGRTAKDYCIYWSRKYGKVVKTKFIINWMRDGSIFRTLLSEYPRKKLTELIDFVFSGHPETDYIKRKGFPISLFPSQIANFDRLLSTPGSSIPEWELEPKVSYWDDNRTAYIWKKLRDGDLDSLLCNIQDDYYWELLLAKMNLQDGFISEKVEVFYEMWKMRCTFERSSIRK